MIVETQGENMIIAFLIVSISGGVFSDGLSSGAIKLDHPVKVEKTYHLNP